MKTLGDISNVLTDWKSEGVTSASIEYVLKRVYWDEEKPTPRVVETDAPSTDEQVNHIIDVLSRTTAASGQSVRSAADSIRALIEATHPATHEHTWTFDGTRQVCRPCGDWRDMPTPAVSAEQLAISAGAVHEAMGLDDFGVANTEEREYAEEIARAALKAAGIEVTE